MAQIKIYAQRETITRFRRAFSELIHQVVVETLSFPKEKKFHRFIAMDKEDFIFPDDKSNDYTIIEILMMEGRSVETKKRLIKTLFAKIEKELELAKENIEIVIIESPAHNWGFRGMTGDEIKLEYSVNV